MGRQSPVSPSNAQRRSALLLALVLLHGQCLRCRSFAFPLHQPNINKHRAVKDRSTTHIAPTIRRRTTLESLSNPLDDAEPFSTPEAITSSAPTHNRRVVRHVEKFTRYPVWPAWNGALIWLVSKLLGNKAASELEDRIGGRVCPNFFFDNAEATSPFLMLVHHCHSFASWDPLRWFQNTFILSEGFPAHPHRGFVTLTYFFQGGFRHRDSTGIEQRYGVHNTASRSFPHSQWLNTGAGLLHEEMFDFLQGASFVQPQRQELYQIWINLPRSEKMNPPSVCLLADNTDTPVVHEHGAQVRVLAGQYRAHQATTPISTDMMILHVTLTGANTRWRCPLENNAMETCFVYMRQGSLDCVHDEGDVSTTIPPHHTAFFSLTGLLLEVHVSPGYDKADFVVLAAVPLREPCVARGSMVMATPSELNRAYTDYQDGLFGLPWDHKLSREEWLEHVQKHPSQYQY